MSDLLLVILADEGASEDHGKGRQPECEKEKLIIQRSEVNVCLSSLYANLISVCARDSNRAFALIAGRAARSFCREWTHERHLSRGHVA